MGRSAVGRNQTTMKADILKTVEQLIRNIPGWHNGQLQLNSPFDPSASPSWHGVDSEIWRAHTSECVNQFLLIKHYLPETSYYIDKRVAIESARRVGEAGFGPRVIAANPADGIIVMEAIDSEWRVAGQEIAADPEIMRELVRQKTLFQQSVVFDQDVSVFADIQKYRQLTKETQCLVPRDLDWMVELVLAAIESAPADQASAVAIHGDSDISNLMVNKHGAIRFVDFDQAGQANPLEDWAITYGELFPLEVDRWVALTSANIGFNPESKRTARYYSIADQLRRGMISAIRARVTSNPTLEFHKYASWQFLRARMAIQDPRFAESWSSRL